MVDLGPDSGGGLAGRFVDGTSLRVGRLVTVSLAALAAAWVAVLTEWVHEVAALVGWLIAAPTRRATVVVDTVVTAGFGGLMDAAVAAAVGSVQGLGPLAFGVGVLSMMGGLYAVASVWGWLF